MMCEACTWAAEHPAIDELDLYQCFLDCRCDQLKTREQETDALAFKMAWAAIAGGITVLIIDWWWIHHVHA
jgi:hypothetical protein